MIQERIDMNKLLKKIVTIILSFIGCFSSQTIAATESTETVTFTGQIIQVPIEGGFYGLVSKTRSSRYIPVGLPDLLKQDGLWVNVTGKKAEDKLGIHMWGEYLHILQIAIDPCSGQVD